MCVLKEYLSGSCLFSVNIHVHRVHLFLIYIVNPTKISRLIHLFGTTGEVFNWEMTWTHGCGLKNKTSRRVFAVSHHTERDLLPFTSSS